MVKETEHQRQIDQEERKAFHMLLCTSLGCCSLQYKLLITSLCCGLQKLIMVSMANDECFPVGIDLFILPSSDQSVFDAPFAILFNRGAK